MIEENTSLARKTLQSTHITSVISISLVLFLLGILGVLLLQANNAGKYVKENFEVSIILNAEVQQAEVNDLLEVIHKSVAVKSAVYVSKDEAATKLKTDLGEDFVSFLGYNPLNPTIDVRFKADFVDERNIAAFKNYLSNKPVIKEFYYQKLLVDKINQNLKSVTITVVTFSILLMMVVVILINNTIRISLYAKRMLIKSMQLVGATKSFIRRPFIIRAMLNGIYSAILACLLVFALVYYAQTYYTEILITSDTKTWLQLGAGLICIGVVISVVSTFFAVNKWLSKSANELH